MKHFRTLIVNIDETMLVQAAVGSLVILLAFVAYRTLFRETAWPFYQKKAMTQAEQNLYFRLVKTLPNHLVLVKVPLAGILGVRKGHRAGRWSRRISGLSADFLVCALDSTIVAAIDLDDKGHETPKEHAANRRRDKALAAAGVKLFRWHVRSIPTDTAIREMLIQPGRYVEPFDEQEIGGAGKRDASIPRNRLRTIVSRPDISGAK